MTLVVMRELPEVNRQLGVKKAKIIENTDGSNEL